MDWVGEVFRTWGPAILTVLLIRSLVAEPFRIPSGSMVPTLAIGDHILVTKYSYGLRWPITRVPMTDLEAPERGDVIVFIFPGSSEGKPSHWLDIPVPPFNSHDYVKRVVGLPGDHVQIFDGFVWVNGELLEEPYVAAASNDPYSFVDTVVQSNSYFVLGDNRIRSSDSREFGQVPFEYLRGKVRFRLWPLSRIGMVR